MSIRYLVLAITVGAGVFLLLMQYIGVLVASVGAVWLSCFPLMLGVVAPHSKVAGRDVDDDRR